MARTPKVVEDRREQIIDAAMRVFSQKGFSRATNKDIAREAGITPGLIYHYFESKEALLNAMIETRSPLKLVSSLPPQAFVLPPDMFIRFLLIQVLSIVEEEKFVLLIRTILPEVIHNPAMRPLAAGVIQRILGFLGSYFEAKMASGELRQMDIGLTTQTLLGSMIAFVLRRQILRDPVALEYSHEQIADAITNIVLQGLLPR